MSIVTPKACALTVAVLALSGCTGAERHTSEPTTDGACTASAQEPAERSDAEPRRVTIATRDDFFDPPCLSLEGGGEITIVVRNAGAHPHNLTLGDGSSVTVDAGQVSLLETSLDSDTVKFTCTLHKGMRGEFQVVDN